MSDSKKFDTIEDAASTVSFDSPVVQNLLQNPDTPAPTGRIEATPAPTEGNKNKKKPKVKKEAKITPSKKPVSARVEVATIEQVEIILEHMNAKSIGNITISDVIISQLEKFVENNPIK